MKAKQIEQIILAAFKERSGYDDKTIIKEAAQAVAAALPDMSEVVEALEEIVP